MSLSDREKQVLEELERNLLADDPNFARKAKARNSSAANSPAKVVAGALLAVIGISILVFAAMTQIVAFGVVGFLVMLFGILIASATGGVKPAKSGPSPNKGKGFFESRWDKRQDR